MRFLASLQAEHKTSSHEVFFPSGDQQPVQISIRPPSMLAQGDYVYNLYFNVS